MDYYKGKGRISLSDEVYNQILAQISEGKWKVGEKLPSESKLCSMFGVSRTSIRAALQNLQGSKIIVTMQGVGSFVHQTPEDVIAKKPVQAVQAQKQAPTVVDISSHDYKEFFEFRLAIEFKAIDFFVRRATAEDEKTLFNLLNKMQDAAKENDYDAYTKQDYEFHMTIIKGARNVFLYEAMSNNKEIFYQYMKEIIRLTDKPLPVLAEEHQILYSYLIEKKPRLAKDYLFSDSTYYHVAYFNK